MSVTPLVTNEITEALAQVSKMARSGEITALIIFAQREGEDWVDAAVTKVGDFSPTPEYLATLIGYLEIEKQFAIQAYAEALDD
jgi:hypothetical protein